MIALEKSFLAQEGRFEKCRIGDFFNVGTGSLLNAKEIKNGNIKRVSVKSDNNGIIGEFNTLDVVNARHFEKFISVNFFGDVFYHDYLASVEMKVHTLQLKSGKELNKELGLYLSSLIRKALNNRFGYGNQLSSSKLKEGAFYIELPILRGRPAWDFMERYIEELEAERIEELEAYLQVTGLKDYRLNKDEINVILSIDKNHSICIGLASQFLEFNDERQDTARKQSSHSNENDVIEWKEFKLGDLFNKIVQGRRLKKDDQMTGNIPFVMAGVTNSGVVNFISNPVASFPKNSITADIFGNIFYRNYNFGAGDDTGVYWSDKHHYSKETMLFFATSMACSLKGKYDFGKKLRSSQSKNIRVNVIVKNNDINYYYMNTLVSAIQKLVIKDVVKWTDKKIATTKKIVQKNKRFEPC